MEHIAAQLFSLALSPPSDDQQGLGGPCDAAASFVDAGMEPCQDDSTRQRLEYVRFPAFQQFGSSGLRLSRSRCAPKSVTAYRSLFLGPGVLMTNPARSSRFNEGLVRPGPLGAKERAE